MNNFKKIYSLETYNQDNIWFNDPKILFLKWYDIVPYKEYNNIKKINIITRLLLYLLVILYIFNVNENIIILLILFFVIINIVGYNNDNLIKKDNHKSIKCRKSTINNPMGNILITTDNKDLNIPACNDTINTKSLIEDNLNYNTYKNIKYNNTVDRYIKVLDTKYPNNMEDYLNFLYKINTNTCRLNNQNCGKWYDIKNNTDNILKYKK